MLRPSMEVSKAFREVVISLLVMSVLLASFGLHVPSECGTGDGVDIESDGSCMYVSDERWI